MQNYTEAALKAVERCDQIVVSKIEKPFNCLQGYLCSLLFFVFEWKYIFTGWISCVLQYVMNGKLGGCMYTYRYEKRTKRWTSVNRKDVVFFWEIFYKRLRLLLLSVFPEYSLFLSTNYIFGFSCTVYWDGYLMSLTRPSDKLTQSLLRRY